MAGKKILKCKYYFDRGTRKSFITYKIGKIAGIYRPNRIRKVGEGDPVRNTDIVVGSRLLENRRGVQLSNDLFADHVLADGNNITIKMETGTGTTCAETA